MNSKQVSQTTYLQKLLAEVREMVSLLTSGEADFNDFFCGTIEGNLNRLARIVEVQQAALDDDCFCEFDNIYETPLIPREQCVYCAAKVKANAIARSKT